MSEKFDWGAVLDEFLGKLIPLLVQAIIDWLTKAKPEEVLSTGKKIGILLKGIQSEL